MDAPVSLHNRRRWRFPIRAGVLAACLMLAAAAGVPLLRERASSEVLSVELGSNLAVAGTDGAQAPQRRGSGETDTEKRSRRTGKPPGKVNRLHRVKRKLREAGRAAVPSLWCTWRAP